jgi:single-stranded-DNA-specific exonuclease
MATGRGKSLIFQVNAIREALVNKKASIFIYPLRSLIADQVFHLSEMLRNFGLSCAALTGETPRDEREELYARLNGQRLQEHPLDIILTTPEFLDFNFQNIPSDKVGFLVVDEAHHIAQAGEGHRSVYAHIGRIRQRYEQACVLATTATADVQTAHGIQSELGIKAIITDATVRENLEIDDQRGNTSRDYYIANMIAQCNKSIIYVNSRATAITLTRTLRKMLPQVGSRIIFYHAGLERDLRLRLEEAFRTGDATCVVSTSAFGEGINIPDISDVVLYHMPFSAIEFNQLSGRAGRNGEPACVHMLYGYDDTYINKSILAIDAPARAQLGTLWRVLRGACYSVGADIPPAIGVVASANAQLTCTANDILRQCKHFDKTFELNAAAIKNGIATFCDLGLMQASILSNEHDNIKSQLQPQSQPESDPQPQSHLDPQPQYEPEEVFGITINEPSQKVNLEDSIRYREGLDEADAFEDFSTWALNASASELLARLNAPLLPC